MPQITPRITPRITPLTPPFEPQIQESFDRIMRGAAPLMLFRTIAKSQRAWDKFRAASLLDRGPLSLRQREIVIDRTCALCGCEYEWGVHVTIFAAAAGLTEEQVHATVTGDAQSGCWTNAEAALIRTVDALHAGATLEEQEYCDLAAHFDETQILEILMLCGFYRTVAYLARALDLPLEERVARFPR
jgi:alkylhydroperoxidase family enzyme